MATDDEPVTLAEQVSVREIGPDTYESVFRPDTMGNQANIAFGGCTIAVGVHAAFQTIPKEEEAGEAGEAKSSPPRYRYNLYTVLGNFLGPALVDRTLRCTVRRLRDTRTFATRAVDVSQLLDDGSSRLCLTLLADFHVHEPAALFNFSAPPMGGPYSPPEACRSGLDNATAAVAAGKAPEWLEQAAQLMMGLGERFCETRACPEGMGAQNFIGALKGVRTTQEEKGLPLTQRTTAEWMRARHGFPAGKADEMAGIAFVMDMGISFIPLSHSGLFLTDAGPCSSLDFGLRFFRSDVDFTQWHLHEIFTVAGADARTYSESRLWDQKGNMVACMTQQAILRPKPEKKNKAKKNTIKASL